MTIVEQRVARGMAWLDANVVGWERSIDLATLDMRDGCNCVLGQTLRDLAKADEPWHWRGREVDAYGWARRKWVWLDVFGFGFSQVDPLPLAWNELEEAWRVAIKRRFDTGVLSDTESAP